MTKTKDRDMFHEGYQDGVNCGRERKLWGPEFTDQDKRDYALGRQKGIRRYQELEAELEAAMKGEA